MLNDHVEFARFLIRLGADPHCESKTKMFVLHIYLYRSLLIQIGHQ